MGFNSRFKGLNPRYILKVFYEYMLRYSKEGNAIKKIKTAEELWESKALDTVNTS